METKIIEITNDHFEWQTNEKGESEKVILSDKKITKQVKVTYDEKGNEISREAYVPEPDFIDTLSEEQLQKLKDRLGL